MKIVAGLGNPGREYESTPHSIGFEVADAVARDIGAAFRPAASFKGELADGRFAGGKVIVVKPMTFMNLSGDCVAPVVKYHNATPADLVVVSDDIDLPVGKIRIRRGGSAGGHNGLKSVIERLGTPDFTRVRIGVGRDRSDRSHVVGHVLGKFPAEVRALMTDRIIPAAVKAICQVLSEGPESAMNAWNGCDLASECR
ncbi:MAG: aminoacyl-tRNA hydrolase [Verrucomicrobiota bacterium]|nr:aminoacyl-tRNA hydrolase [Verrucomicrobiota bacterium]